MLKVLAGPLDIVTHTCEAEPQHVILVPNRLVARVPFSGLPVSSDKLVLDTTILCFRPFSTWETVPLDIKGPYLGVSYWRDDDEFPLHFAESEVKACAKFCVKEGIESTLILRPDAKREGLPPSIDSTRYQPTSPDIMSACQKAQIVHLATHLRKDKNRDDLEDQSVIHLSGDDTLTHLNINKVEFDRPALVILSMCGSGQGDINKGVEDNYMFSRHFARAGATHMVVSIVQQLDDWGSAVIVPRMFKILLENPKLTAAEALHQAQLWFKNADPKGRLDNVIKWCKEEGMLVDERMMQVSRTRNQERKLTENQKASKAEIVGALVAYG